MDTSEPITLREYTQVVVPSSRISREVGQRLWEEFGSKITVEEPSFKNGYQWKLTSEGWVGFLPFSEDLNFFLAPKVPLENLFGMWEYAYRLESFKILSDLYRSQDLQQFYEQLASVLAKRILDRERKGYYRAYIDRTEDLSFVRGRLDMHAAITKPWLPRPRCNYQENTADVVENQLLAWTLYTILRSGFCSERVLPILRKSYRSLLQAASLQSFQPEDCLNRFYHRLNEDYEPLHALCRFFLENTGPSYQLGERRMLPFLVNMARLFELFVAEWLRAHLPKGYELNAQDQVYIGAQGEVNFKIDLVITDAETKQAVCVLDTKYKRADSPSSDDIAQVHLYANLKGCRDAVLVYPAHVSRPLDQTINGTRVRTAAFSLGGDLETAGRAFLAEILW